MGNHFTRGMLVTSLLMLSAGCAQVPTVNDVQAYARSHGSGKVYGNNNQASIVQRAEAEDGYSHDPTSDKAWATNEANQLIIGQNNRQRIKQHAKARGGKSKGSYGGNAVAANWGEQIAID